MDRKDYVNLKQDEAFEEYKGGVMFQEDIEKVYEEIDYKVKLPDLLGKTVKVSEKQFPEFYSMIQELCAAENMDCPAVYVYEDYYYGAESYGIGKPWIELSAKTIQDFSHEEIRFVLAREIYKIADGVTKQRTMMEERFKVIRSAAPDQLEKVSRLSFYHWYRLANYTADNYGYLSCGSIKSSINAILLMVLNSRLLVEHTDVKEFIAQASEINRLNDGVFNYTKADEAMPYAPHRIQNLLAYAESERGIITKQ
ncbi:MAG: M48 family metallopeptidase [Butyrivibrio sp.]|nr:M48 family metallopeptidase [Butyrivibrio sp.]